MALQSVVGGFGRLIDSCDVVCNAGPLLQPRGQTSVLYSVPPAEAQQEGGISSTQQGSGTSSTQQQSRTDADEATTVGAQQNKREQQEGS